MASFPITQTCRKRRLYAQQDLSNLLQHEGLEAKLQKPDVSIFALEVFDNADYESRLPTQWVPKTPGGWLDAAEAAMQVQAEGMERSNSISSHAAGDSR